MGRVKSCWLCNKKETDGAQFEHRRSRLCNNCMAIAKTDKTSKAYRFVRGFGDRY